MEQYEDLSSLGEANNGLSDGDLGPGETAIPSLFPLLVWGLLPWFPLPAFLLPWLFHLVRGPPRTPLLLKLARRGTAAGLHLRIGCSRDCTIAT